MESSDAHQLAITHTVNFSIVRRSCPSRLSVFRHLSFYVMRQIIFDRWFLFYPAIFWHVLVNLGLKQTGFKGHSLMSLRISFCCQVHLVDPIITNPCKRVVLRYKGLKGATSEYAT